MSFIRQGKLKQTIKRIVFIFIGLYVMIGTSLYFLQEKLIFLPTKLEQNYKFKFKHKFEELFLKTEENSVINALHFKVENPKGAILYFHGNAGDLSRWGTIAEYFVEKDYDVLIMDYRTYGKSTGKLSETAFYHDAEFCYEYLKDQYKESEITIYGRSLGTVVATYLASKYWPKQLVLETPYYSMVDVAERRYPIFPVKKLMNFEFPSYKFLEDVACPVTMIHGTNDYVVPMESAKKLYQSVENEKVSLTIIEGGSHNDLSNFEAYHKVIDKVLR